MGSDFASLRSYRLRECLGIQASAMRLMSRAGQHDVNEMELAGRLMLRSSSHGLNLRETNRTCFHYNHHHGDLANLTCPASTSVGQHVACHPAPECAFIDTRLDSLKIGVSLSCHLSRKMPKYPTESVDNATFHRRVLVPRRDL